jgi:hypothetical protein
LSPLGLGAGGRHGGGGFGLGPSLLGGGSPGEGSEFGSPAGLGMGSPGWGILGLGRTRVGQRK